MRRFYPCKRRDTSINTYLAKANTSYSTNTEAASLKVYTKDEVGMTYSVDVDDVPEVEGVEKDAFMLVYLSGKDGGAASVTDYNRFEVVNIFDTEILSEAEVTKFSTHDTKVVDKLTTGGTEYKSNPKAFYDKDEDVLGIYNQELLSDTTYNVYLDRYSNVIGVDLYSGNRNYVFITGFDRGTSHISTKTADAAAIFLDGTMETITVNVTDTDKNIKKVDDPYFGEWMKGGSRWNAGGGDNEGSDKTGNHSENRWYTYTQSANGTYTLKPATRMFATDYNYNNYSDKMVTLDSANLYVEDNGTKEWNGGDRINPVATTKGRAYGEDESIYITVETDYVDTTGERDDIAITDVQGVFKGAQDVKMDLSTETQKKVPNAVYTLYDNDNYIIAAIVAGEARGAAASYAYITSGVKSERVEKNNSTRANDYTYYWEFDAFYNGEIQTLTAKTDYPPEQYDLDQYTVRELRFNGEYVSDVAAPKASKIQNTNEDNARIDDMDVYDVGHITVGYNGYGSNWPGYSDDLFYVHPTNTKTGENIGTEADGFQGAYDVTAKRLEGTIYLQGRTLYIEQDGDRDVGLALGRDIPALLVQNENRHNNDPEKRVYSSVSEAVNNIADCNGNKAGTQFRGRIAAALDGKGVAQWIVIISDKTLWTGKDPNYDVKDSYLRWIQWNETTQTGRYWELYIPGYEDGTSISSTEIRNALADCGCSDISRTGSNWNFTYGGTRYTDQVVRVVDTYWGDEVVHVKSVTLNETEKTVKVGEKFTLTATVSPSNATYPTVTWTTSDSSIATVSGGVVTGEKAGTATITATADGVKAECTVTVEEAGKPVGDPVTVTFNTKGTGKAGTHYEVEGLVDGNTSVKTDDSFKMKVGETLTIRAGLEIYVHQNGGAGKNVAQFGRENIMPEDDMEIYVNAAGFIPGDNNSVSWGEVWATGETPFGAAAVASMMAYARMTSDNFAKIRFSLAGGNYTDWYTVKILNNGTIANGPWQFGKNVDIIPLLGQLNASLAQRTKPVATENENNPTTDDIAEWNGETPEPSTVDPRTLKVQATTSGANDEQVSFKVYFDGKSTGKVKVEEKDIIAAFEAETSLGKPVSVDIKGQKANMGNKTVSWTGIDKEGYASSSDVTVLYKIVLESDTYYLFDDDYDGTAGEQAKLPVSDKSVKYLLDSTKGYAAAADTAVTDGLANTITVSGADATYVKAYQVKFNISVAKANTMTAISGGGKNVQYSVAVTGDNGVKVPAPADITANTVFFAQAGAKFSFKEDTATAAVGQRVSVKIDGVEQGPYTLNEAGAAPKINPIEIPAPAVTTDPATNGIVSVEFALLPAADREKHVYLNNNELLNPEITTDANGVETQRVYTITGLKKGMVVLPAETKDGKLKPIAAAVAEVGGAGNSGVFKYTWTAGTDTDACEPTTGDGPLSVYLYTAWPVKIGSTNKVFTKVNEYGQDTTNTDDQLTSTKGWSSEINGAAGAFYYFKTSENKQLFVEAATAGDQLWWKKDKNVTGLTPYQLGGEDMPGAGKNADKKLNGAIPKGTWVMTVNKAIDMDADIGMAYNVDATQDETAKYATATDFTKLAWKEGVDLEVSLNGTAKSTGLKDIVTGMVFKRGAGDKNVWELYWKDADTLSIRVIGRDDGVQEVDGASAMAGNPVIEFTLMGGYVVKAPVSSK